MPSEKLTPALWTDDERWQALMENVKDYGIFMLDPEGKIATWNLGAERILGYKEEEILGHNFCEIFTPHDIGKEQPKFELQEAKEKGRAEDERWHLRKDGARFWASGVVTPLWGEDGVLRGYTKVLRDITERKQFEDHMAEENKRKDEFLAMLSHELRNPLSAISSAADLLKLEHSASVTEIACLIHRQANSLAQLVDDLTDVSRMTSGKIQLRVERCRLQDLIKGTVESIRHIIEERKHELLISVPDEAIWMDADPTRLQQAFGNVLTNSAKYTDPGGRIWFSVARVGNEAFVKVRDDGNGIAADMLGRIFDLFIQADCSLDRSQGGLGIGLTVAKRLMEMHGGKIEAFSSGVGQGSEFVMHLPVVAEIDAGAANTVPESVLPTEGLRLLLAEDNQDTAKMMALLLRNLGHEVEVVHDGAAALQAVQATKPDVVLMDIGLPVLSGYEVAERFRQQPELNDTRLFALTGYGRPEDRHRSKLAGFNHHFTKPVNFQELQALLSQVAEGSVKE